MYGSQGELDLIGSGFNTQALALSGLVRDTDIVGVPYRTSVEHEYNILSITSICSLVNVLRSVRDAAIQTQAFCRQDVHVALY